MPFQPVLDARAFRLGFLYAVFADTVDAGGARLGDARRVDALRYGNQLNAARIAPRRDGRLGDAFQRLMYAAPCVDSPPPFALRRISK